MGTKRLASFEKHRVFKHRVFKVEPQIFNTAIIHYYRNYSLFLFIQNSPFNKKIDDRVCLEKNPATTKMSIDN